MIKALIERLSGQVPVGAVRSPEWALVRHVHLEAHPQCICCGADKKLEVHHIIPFHIAPQLELDPNNLVTLCRGGRFKSLNCHLVFGHLCSWKRFNLSVHSDAINMKNRLEEDA